MQNLHGFLPHLEQMGKDGMSDDEDAHEDGMRVYEPGIPHWRSREITLYLRILDLLHLSTKFNAFNIASPGNWPRIRTPSQRTADRSPVALLPQNFYEPVWLETLTKEQTDALQMRPAIPFTHSEKELRSVGPYITSNIISHATAQDSISAYECSRKKRQTQERCTF